MAGLPGILSGSQPFNLTHKTFQQSLLKFRWSSYRFAYRFKQPSYILYANAASHLPMRISLPGLDISAGGTLTLLVPG